jgi:hypothetical protein
MAKYKGRTVKLNKPMRGDVKKFKVFVKDRSQAKLRRLILVLRLCLSKRIFQLEKDHSWLGLVLSWLKLKDQANN